MGKKQIFWNSYIRLLIEIFFEITLTSLLNVKHADWSTPFRSAQSSNYIAAFLLVVSILSPILMITFAWTRKDQWSSDLFKSRYGELLVGVRSESARSKSSTIFMPIAFLARRFLFVLSVFYFDNRL